MVDALGDTAVWLQLVATIYLVGLIWCIQIVHYPLMNRIETQVFADFHRQHSLRIGSIVIVPMVIEFITSIWVVVFVPNGVTPALPILGMLLTAVIWISTFGIQVPLHRKLKAGFDARTHESLVRSNWVRTVAWTMRAGIAVSIAIAA
jgi:hypothetical protein